MLLTTMNSSVCSDCLYGQPKSCEAYACYHETWLGYAPCPPPFVVPYTKQYFEDFMKTILGSRKIDVDKIMNRCSGRWIYTEISTTSTTEKTTTTSTTEKATTTSTTENTTQTTTATSDTQTAESSTYPTTSLTDSSTRSTVSTTTEETVKPEVATAATAIIVSLVLVLVVFVIGTVLLVLFLRRKGYICKKNKSKLYAQFSYVSGASVSINSSGGDSDVNAADDKIKSEVSKIRNGEILKCAFENPEYQIAYNVAEEKLIIYNVSEREPRIQDMAGSKNSLSLEAFQYEIIPKDKEMKENQSTLSVGEMVTEQFDSNLTGTSNYENVARI